MIKRLLIDWKESCTKRMIEKIGRALRKAGANSLIISALKKAKLTPRKERRIRALEDSEIITAFKRVVEALISLWCIIDSRWMGKTKTLNEKAKESWIGKNIVSPYAIMLALFFLLSASMTRFYYRTLIFIGVCFIFMVLGTIIGYKFSEGIAFDCKISELRIIRNILLVVGLTSLIYQLVDAGGIPLLNEALRTSLKPVYCYLAWSLVPACFISLAIRGEREDKIETRGVLTLELIVYALIVSLLGFRTEVIVLIVGGITILYHRKIYEFSDLIVGVGAAALIYILIGVVRYRLAGVAVNPFIAVLGRNTITTENLDLLVRMYGLKGYTNGYIHLAVVTSIIKVIPGPRYGPRRIISRILGLPLRVSTTTTLIGPLIVDLGIKGTILFLVILFFILGFFFKLSEKNPIAALVYGTVFAYTLVSVETGLLDLVSYVHIGLMIAIGVKGLKVEE